MYCMYMTIMSCLHLDKLVDKGVRESLIHLECIIKKHILHKAYSTLNYINDFNLENDRHVY